ncbi:MAG: PAS domain S-box protein [Flavobacterium sp.]
MKYILISTHNTILTEFISGIFQNNEYVLEIANSSIQAVEILSKHSFDLVLFDLDFPQSESDILIEFLKTQNLEQLPVVLLGDSSDENKIEELLETGFRDFILKSVSATLLKVKIKQLIQQSDLLKEKNNKLTLFKSIADYSNNLETFRDPDNKIIYCSPSVKKILGYSPEEYIQGIPLDQLIHPEDLNRAIEIFSILMNRDSVDSFIFRLINKNKEEVWLDGSAQPVFSDSGEFIGCRISNKDITQLKNIEHELAESNARYKLISDSSLDWEVYRDATGKMVYCSPAVERVLGYTVDEFMQEMPFEQYIYSDDIEKSVLDTEYLLSQKKPLRNTYRFIKKDGTMIYLEISAQTVVTDDNIYNGFRLSGRDITEKVLLEQELKKLYTTKDMFLSIISHDLRSPLTALLGLSELLYEQYDELTKEEHKEYISIIYNASQNTLKLLDNLLLWSRTQSDSIVLHKEKIDLKLFTQEIISISNPAIHKKKITLLNLIHDNIAVYADVNMLNTILRNLISNAIKYTPNSGTITINTVVKDKFAIISVADTGIGIPEEVKNTLFISDAIHSTPGTEHEKGTGLGLLLCKEFVKKQNGKIWVESELGKGSVFKFTIPLFE